MARHSHDQEMQQSRAHIGYELGKMRTEFQSWQQLESVEKQHQNLESEVSHNVRSHTPSPSSATQTQRGALSEKTPSLHTLSSQRSGVYFIPPTPTSKGIPTGFQVHLPQNNAASLPTAAVSPEPGPSTVTAGAFTSRDSPLPEERMERVKRKSSKSLGNRSLNVESLNHLITGIGKISVITAGRRKKAYPPFPPSSDPSSSS